MEQFEFLSDSWLSSLEGAAQQLLDRSDAGTSASFVYVEKFTDAPAASPEGKDPGYVLRLEEGKATIAAGVSRDNEAQADCMVRMDYGVALESMKYRIGPELAELSEKAAADGHMELTGSMAGAPIPMHELHDAAVEFTVL